MSVYISSVSEPHDGVLLTDAEFNDVLRITDSGDGWRVALPTTAPFGVGVMSPHIIKEFGLASPEAVEERLKAAIADRKTADNLIGILECTAKGKSELVIRPIRPRPDGGEGGQVFLSAHGNEIAIVSCGPEEDCSIRI
jgi:hypothetical protein